MTDLSLTRDSELMVFQVEGTSEEGEEFVDGYVAAEMVVVDAARIILPESEKPALLAAARERGLSVAEEDLR